MGKRKLSLILPMFFLFCMLALLVASLSRAPVARANPTTIFSDGFESGDFSAWTLQFTDPGDTVEVITGAAHSGSYGLHTINNGSADVAITKKVFATSYTTLYDRVYVYMLNIPTETDGYIRFFDLRHGSTQDFGCGLMRDNSSNYEWFIHYPNGSGYSNSYSSTFTPSSATWYCLEIKAVVSDTVGEARLYVNGAETITVTGSNTGTNALDATEVGIGLIDDTPPTSDQTFEAGVWYGANYIEVHEDNVVVADSYIGPQYYLAVASAYGVASGQDWYDNGATAYATLASGTVSGGVGIQYVFTGWSGDASGTGLTSDAITMDGNKTATADWTTQYYLTMSTNFGSVSPSSGWVDAASPVTIYAVSPSVVSGEQYVWNGWTGSGTGSYTGSGNDSSLVTMNGPITESASWTHQYYLTVNSVYDTPGGEGWYDADLTAYASLSSGTVSGGSGTQYVFTGWVGDASGTGLTSNAITMNSSKTALANWKTQYSVTYAAIGNATAVPVPSDEWVDSSGSAVGVFPTQVTNDGTRCNFVSDNRTSITEPSLIVGTYTNQYNLTFTSFGVGSDFSGTVVTVNGTGYDRNGTSFWANPSDVYNFSYASPLSVTLNVKQYIWIYTGGLSGDQSGFISVSFSGSIIGHYATQYNVTFAESGLDGTASGTVVTVNGSAEAFAVLPFSMWVNSSDTINYNYLVIVTSTISSQRFRHYSTTGSSSPITVTGPASVTGNYVTQYNVTFTQSGVDVDFSDSVLNVYSVNYGRAGVTGWYDNGANVSFSYYSPLTVTSDVKQYVLTGVSGNTTASSLIVSAATTVTGTYGTQWHIVITSAHGSPTEASQWVDDGSGFNVSVTNPDVISILEHQWNLTGLMVDGVPQTLNDTVSFAAVHASHTIEFDWTEQYYLTVNSAHDTAGGAGWYDGGSTAYATLTDGTVSGGFETQYVFTSWGTDASGTNYAQSDAITMDGPKTATATWTTQYQVSFHETGLDGDSGSNTILSAGGTNYVFTDFPVDPIWVDSGTSFSWTTTVSGGAGKQFVLTGDSGLASPITAPGTSSATYKVQYQVSFVVTPSGSGSSTPAGTDIWQDSGSLSISALANPGYMFSTWSSDTISITFVDSTLVATTATIGGPGTVTANFVAANASLAVRGMDNEIYYRAYNSSTGLWSSWNVLPSGTTLDSPATAISGGIQYFVVRGMDGYTLWFSWINQSDNSFSGWTYISGLTPSAPTLTTNGTALTLIVRGSDNSIYYRTFTIETQTWNDWNVLPSGTTCDQVAAAMIGNTLHIVVRGFSTTDAYMNDTMWYANVTDGAFSGWTLLPGLTPSAPTLAASSGDNMLYLIVEGTNNVIYTNKYDGVDWLGWIALPSGSTINGPAATVTGDTLNIVVVGMDGNTLWYSSMDLSTSSFSGWTLVTGTTPSKPTQAS